MKTGFAAVACSLGLYGCIGTANILQPVVNADVSAQANTAVAVQGQGSQLATPTPQIIYVPAAPSPQTTPSPLSDQDQWFANQVTATVTPSTPPTPSAVPTPAPSPSPTKLSGFSGHGLFGPFHLNKGIAHIEYKFKAVTENQYQTRYFGVYLVGNGGENFSTPIVTAYQNEVSDSNNIFAPYTGDYWINIYEAVGNWEVQITSAP